MITYGSGCKPRKPCKPFSYTQQSEIKWNIFCQGESCTSIIVMHRKLCSVLDYDKTKRKNAYCYHAPLDS